MIVMRQQKRVSEREGGGKEEMVDKELQKEGLKEVAT